MSARDGFFTAGRMFALVGETSLWLRLPVPTTTALVEENRGQPLVGASIPSQLTWVAVELPPADPAELHHLVLTAHQAVRAASRRSRRDRTPARRRRSRSSA